jgi:hypothetical protein
MRLPILTFAVLVALAASQPAHAYIDPGTGSLILQGLVALFVGAAFTLKMFYREKIKPVIDWILRRPRPAAPPEDSSPEGGSEPRKDPGQ